MSPQKHVVTIDFRSPGAQPPVFVAGTFSEPQWKPYELDFESYTPEDGDGSSPKYLFFKRLEVPAGEYQYKFRLGPGDWWVCDENEEIVTDDAGNRNNLLHVITAGSSTTNGLHNNKHIHDRPLQNEEALNQFSTWKVEGLASSNKGKSSTVDVEGSPDPPTTDVQEDRKVHIKIPPMANLASAVALKEVQGDFPKSTLLPEKHAGDMEALESDPSKSQIETDDMGDTVLSLKNDRNNNLAKEYEALDNSEVSHDEINQIRQLLPQQHQADFVDGLKGEVEEDTHQSHNLLEKSRHCHAPLFSHECLSCPEVAPHCHWRSSHNSEAEERTHNSKVAKLHEPSEAEILDDPTIEMFPSEPMEILKRIATLHSELAEDDSVDEDASSPHCSPTFAGQPSPMLPHEMPIVNELLTPRHSFDAGVDGALESRPILQPRSPGSKGAAYQASDMCNGFEEMKVSEEDENEPLLKARDLSAPVVTQRCLDNPSSKGIRKRASGADSIPTTVSELDSSESVDNSSGFLGGFLDAIFYWFGSCLFAFFGGKHRE